MPQNNSELGTSQGPMREAQGVAAAPPAKISPPIEFYITRARTSVNIVDEAISDLQASRHAFWMGDHPTVLKKCTWKANSRSNVSTLQYKPDAQDKPGDGVGDALIAFIGLVASERSAMGPDAGYQVSIHFMLRYRTSSPTFLNRIHGALMDYLNKSVQFG